MLASTSNGNKIIGFLFLLVGAAFGLFFFGTEFQHGYDEGMYNLRHMGGEAVLGLGMVTFLIAGVFLLMRKKAA